MFVKRGNGNKKDYQLLWHHIRGGMEIKRLSVIVAFI